MKSIALMCFVAGLGGGCSNTAQPDMMPLIPPVPLQASLQFSDSNMSMGAGMTSKQFNFAHLRDLSVRLTVPALVKTSQMKLRFINPRGERFYEEAAWFSPDPAIKTMPGQAGAPPVMVRTAGQVMGGFTLDLLIPIGGSLFQRFPEAGSWVVEAQLDGFDGMVTSTLQIETKR